MPDYLKIEQLLIEQGIDVRMDHIIIQLLPINFFKAPSSSSGRYHLKNETLGQHTYKVLEACIKICKYFNLNKEETSKVVVAAIVHDMCKYSDDRRDNLLMYQNKCRTRNDHAERAYRVLLNYDVDIAKIVRSHMQKWSKVPEMDLIWGTMINGTCTDRAYQLGLVISYADYKTSKPELKESDIIHLKEILNAMRIYNEENYGK